MFLNYIYLYWCENLTNSESQQVLFAMDCTGRYINPTNSQLKKREWRDNNYKIVI